MQIELVAIRNFRLLKDVSLGLEEGTTLIVARKICRKTPILEFPPAAFGQNTFVQTGGLFFR